VCATPIADAVVLPDEESATTALVVRGPSAMATASAVKAKTEASPVKPIARRGDLLLAAGGGAVVAAAVTFALLTAHTATPATLAAAPSAAATPPSPSAAAALPTPSAAATPPAPPAVATLPAPAKPVAALVIPPPLVVQKWSSENRKVWLGSARGAAFELLSDNSVQTWFGLVQPVLVVRCVSRSMETFVVTRSAVKIEPNVDGRTVTVSLDGEPAQAERWSSSDDRVALFAPDGAAFAERLMHAHTLQFGYSPHNSKDVVAQFNVAGLGELIEPVARECGRKK
jgi:hypothetical protein